VTAGVKRARAVPKHSRPLVQQDRHLPLLRCARCFVEFDHRRGLSTCAEFGDALTVDENPAALDIDIGITPPNTGALGHQFGDPHTALRRPL